MSDETKNKPVLEEKRVQCDVRYRREKDADFKCQRRTGRILSVRLHIGRSRYGYQNGNRQTHR